MDAPLPFATAPLLYTLTALAALVLIHRLVRPLSVVAAIVLALLPLAMTGRALLTQRVFGPLDVPLQVSPLASLPEAEALDDRVTDTRYDIAFRVIPWRKAARYAIELGEWPLWNPFIVSGDVLAATGEAAVYHPIHLLGYLLPLDASLGFIASWTFLLAALGAFLFAREVGCQEDSALIAAAAWMLCGFLVFWSGWSLGLAVALFPLVLFATRRIVHQPAFGSMLVLAASLVLLLLAGHPETVLHAVALGGLYGLWELSQRQRHQRGIVVGFAIAAGAVALLVAAVDLLPLLEAVPQSEKFHQRRASPGKPISVPLVLALERLRVLFLPFAYGNPPKEWLREAGAFGATWLPYTGSVLLAPAVLGLLRGKWRGRWILALLSLLTVPIYVAAPGLIDLLQAVPGFDVSINRRLIFILGVTVAVLAALGLDGCEEKADRRRLALLCIAVTAVMGLALFVLWPSLRESGLSADYLRSRAALELAPPLVVGVLCMAVRSRRLLLAGIMVLLVGQRLVQVEGLNPSFPREQFYPPLTQLTTLMHAAVEGEPYRVMALRPLLTPNLSALYELEDPRGDSPMVNRRLASTFELWARRAGIVPLPTNVDAPFLDFLNVRYVLTPRGLPAPAGWRLVGDALGVSLLENESLLPRAFVPRQVRFSPPDQLPRAMAEATDFAEMAWIELPAPPGVYLDETNGPGTVAIRRRGTGFELEATMEDTGWVVISETAWKGWKAVSEGQRFRLAFANHAFLGLELPAGHHRVELSYRPTSFVVGRFLSITTLLGLLATVLSKRWLHNRRGHR